VDTSLSLLQISIAYYLERNTGVIKKLNETICVSSNWFCLQITKKDIAKFIDVNILKNFLKRLATSLAIQFQPNVNRNMAKTC